MGKGIKQKELERQQELDNKVKKWLNSGLSNKDIAQLVDSTVMGVAYSIRRLTNGYSQVQDHPDYGGAEREAQMLIDAKLAPTHTPKAHRIMVNGWENGRYVHYEAIDVSEFWGIGGN